MEMGRSEGGKGESHGRRGMVGCWRESGNSGKHRDELDLE